MGLSGVFRTLPSLVLVMLVAGCAGVDYRERSTVTHTRYATVENYGDQLITALQVDDLLEEVAQILKVTLDLDVPKVRIIVMPAARIADLHRKVVTVALHGADARALYFPGANLVAIPYYSRTILGHELAHYLTDHYLKSTPRRSWERIALEVEDALPATRRTVARRAPAPDVVGARAALVP